MRNKKKAFTLVEMLVALAVSSIIIAATYASYELIQKQYKRNIDIAEMHTSGRSIMQVLEREIRMAGYEFRDANGTMTYGSIVGGLAITDSGDTCCDEVTLIYDDVEDVVNAKGEVTSSSVERIKIRFWTEAYTSNKGDRFRLYKRKTILGRNNAILGTPIVGAKEVMADYIEDLQFFIDSGGLLYVGTDNNYIMEIDTTQKKQVGTISQGITYRTNGGMAFGPDGLLYVGTDNNYIMVIDTDQKKQVATISQGITYRTNGYMVFGPDGLLYVGSNNHHIMVIDTTQKKQVATISQGIRIRANGGMAFGPEGNLYVGNIGAYMMVVDTAQKKLISFIKQTYFRQVRGGFEFGSDGLLYAGSGSNYISRFDLSKKSGQQTLSGIQQGISTTTKEDMAFGSDGLLYVGATNNNYIMVIDTDQKKQVATISQGISYRTNGGMAFKPEKSLEANSAVSINLTLRAKNEYGRISKDFLKKDYFSGNFNIKKNDLFKRDTFSTTVSVRNL